MTKTRIFKSKELEALGFDPAGNAYRLDADGNLELAPEFIDGSVDTENWAPPLWGFIDAPDADSCKSIEAFLRKASNE